MNFQALTRRSARLTTNIVVRWPRLWFLLRPLTRFQFDRLAPQWDAIRASETAYAPYEAALERVDPPPKRALDLGTGTGGAGTPIYVPTERLLVELERRGFTDFAEFSTDPGTALLARKRARA